MHRAVRWLQLGGRQREYAICIALGCSTVAGYDVYRNRRPILADSEHLAEDWRGKTTITAHNRSLSDRVKSTGEATAVPADSSRRQGTPLVETTQVPPPQTRGHSDFDLEGGVLSDPLSSWKTATDRVSAVCGTFTGFDFTSIREKIAGILIPTWIRMLPGWFTKLKSELSMEPWSLSWEIWEEAHDPQINPEIVWDAKVRISSELCPEEQAFLKKRRKRTVSALARYLGVPESEIHEDDVPTIGICGSGGGLRALVAGNASYLSAAQDGLFDCVTYSAGVSGSCWGQALYYSSIGRQSHAHIIDHLKDRLSVHIAYPPALLSLLSQAPTNKYLLSGYVEKLLGVPDADFGLVDVYGLALAARLLVPRDNLRISDYDLKVSNQRFHTDDGSQPLPIYTAVRHEIPKSVRDVAELAKESRFTAKHYDSFQWFEWTPYEFFCEELDAGIPTWAVGRRWSGGNGLWRENGFALPELRTPLMMGIWGSAFCATLSQYYKELSPILRASGMGGLDTLLAGKSEDLVKVHPIDPALIPNFALGLRDRLPDSCPESIHESTHLQLMDAGIANNLPIYPLLRPGRNVDVIVAFDASADVRGDNWIKVIDGYARQRKIKGWPMGAGWPPRSNTEDKTVEQLDQAQAAATDSSNEEVTDSNYLPKDEPDLGYCTVWSGTVQDEKEYMDEATSNRISDWEIDRQHLMSANAGIAVVYFPFLANEEKVPGVDPLTADFMSTWNFVYKADEVDKVVALAKANFDEGKEQTRRTIRAVWERKKSQRLEKEQKERDLARRARMLRGQAAMRRNGDFGQGDHFGGI